MSTPTDTLYPMQSHFDHIGDIEAVWDDYTGRGVRVAVYDFGIDITHPDLVDNYLLEDHFSFGGITQDGLPDQPEDPSYAHGTAIAGLIAAGANGKGTVGVAYGAYLTSIELDGIFTTAEMLAAGIRHANKFEVMNNSWGLTAPFWSDAVNVNIVGSTVQILDSAYATVAASGRNGLGTIIVQSAGNDDYDVLGDGLNASRYSILVGATTEYDNRTYYSNFGPSILLYARAAEVTTDNVEGGYNSPGAEDGDTLHPNYTSDFGGTSASAALVSGVVALMLEANPELGWRDVKNILAMSADVDQKDFSITQNNNTHQDNWNFGSLIYGEKGFGILDARAAVRMAESYMLIGNEPLVTANEVIAEYDFDVGDGVIPDATEVFPQDGTPYTMYGSRTFFSDRSTTPIVIETVEVTVTLTHSYSSDLKITLFNSGKTFVLLNRTGGSTLMDDGFTWTFRIEGFRGSLDPGNWQLTIEDIFHGESGILESAIVRVIGQSDTVDDVYTFTDDARENLQRFFSKPNPDLLLDTDGGIDWLNFAAASMDVVAALDPQYNGGIGFDPGAAPIFSNLSNIENVILGDGNDEFRGNALDNIAYGGRGNDYLLSSKGTDTAYGGSGDDFLSAGFGGYLLYGGEGNDRIHGSQTYLTAPTGLDLILFGGTGSDTIMGGIFDEELYGDEQDDTISTGEGNDTLFAGHGNDSVMAVDYFDDGGDDLIYGGDGNDFLSDFSGFDTIFGDAGDDTLTVQRTTPSARYGNASLFGGDGHDRINGATGSDSISGDVGSDSLFGNAGADILIGGRGDDLADGGDDSDHIFGGKGNDRSLGGLGDDSLDGGAGNDVLRGSEGLDSLLGQDGHDTVFGGSGDDVIWTSTGDDSALGDDGNDLIRAGDGADKVNGGTGNDTADGGRGDDEVLGEDGDDHVIGGGGGDVLRGGDGADSLEGGSGNDTLSGDAGADRLSGNDGNDSLKGDGGDDSIAGGAGLDDLLGGQGRDLLSGGDGIDRLDGSEGNDELSGGRGVDIFFFRLGSGRDVVTDFRDDTDALRLDHNLWLAQGDLTARQVVQTFGSIDAQGQLVLDFGADVLVIAALGTRQALYDDLRII